MQPQKLNLQNFGPFKNETIDFTKLNEAPLFLISGKTGAGKTTIFDGMTFALFGESSGKLRTGKDMRSLFALPEEETSVTFTFEHQSMIYQICRKPEQLLTRKKGKGLKTQAAKVELTIFDASGKEKEQYTKRTEIDQHIQALLHLNAKQFSQIVLLPQGEFRNFLISSSKEKELVLRNLFGTQLFQQLNEKLKEQSKQKQKEIDHLEQELTFVARQFSWDEVTEVDEMVTIDVRLKSWETNQNLRKKKIEAITEDIERAKLEKKRVEQVAYQVQTQLKQKHEKEMLEKEYQQLSDQTPEIEKNKEELAIYTFAKECAPLIEQKNSDQANYLAKQDYLKKLTADYEDNLLLKSAWTLGQEQRDVRAKKQKQQEEMIQNLRSLLPLAKEKEALTLALETQRAALVAHEEALSVWQQKKHELSEKVAAFEVVLQDELILQQEHFFIESLLVTEADIKESKSLINEQSLDCEKLEKQIELETEKLVQTREKSITQEKFVTCEKSKWAKQQIQQLQKLLIPGEPCPVCGSIEHAVSSTHYDELLETDICTEDELQKAELEADRLRRLVLEQTVYLEKKQSVRVEAIKKIEEAQAKISKAEKQLEAQLFEHFPLYVTDSITNSLANIQKVHQQKELTLKQAKAEKNERNKELERVKTAIQELKEQRLDAQANEQHLSGQLEILTQQVGESTYEELLDKCKKLEKDTSQIAAELADEVQKGQIYQEQEQLFSLKMTQTRESSQELEDSIAEKKKTIQQKITTLDNPLTEEEILALASGTDKEVALQKKIQTFNDRKLIIETRIDQLSKTTVPITETQVKEAENDLAQWTETVDKLTTTVHQIGEKIERNQHVIQQYQEIYQQSQVEIDTFIQLKQLSQIMNGENERKISIERYVLQVYLAEVLAVANQKIHRLTKNRYQFELGQETGSYRGTTGLEIDIYDDEVGATRSAYTLSGGESFIAALALALGLAEVIQSQAGGVTIEALFIDEGFGSLDEEALSMAMEALETIENEGRMIGIISHVRELKERVPQQIRLIPDGRGKSKISYHFG